MKIFIYPTYDPKRDKSGNLYIDYFRKAFEASGQFEVCNSLPRSETLGLLLNLRAKVFVLHWVDLIPSKPLGFLQVLFFKAGVLAARLRGAEIVWVLHNKNAHDDKSSRPARLMDWMARRADAVLTHSEEGCRFFRTRYPDLKIPCIYIPHPVYDSRIVKAGHDAFDWDYIVWGTVTARKRVLEFVRFVASCKELEDKKILICGRCRDTALDNSIRQALPPNILYENRFLTDAELEDRISRSRTILFTYEPGSVLSSGALIYSLNFLRPIIGPRVGSFMDMEGIVSCYDTFEDIPSLDCPTGFRENIEEYLSTQSWENFPVRFAREFLSGISE